MILILVYISVQMFFEPMTRFELLPAGRQA